MTHYEVLGVPPTATHQEIRLAYKLKATHAHPDRPGGTREAFERIKAAYETLCDPEARKRYDLSLQAGDLAERSQRLGRQFAAQVVTEAEGVLGDLVMEAGKALRRRISRWL